jgi:hypothetical protein
MSGVRFAEILKRIDLLARESHRSVGRVGGYMSQVFHVANSVDGYRKFFSAHPLRQYVF